MTTDAAKPMPSASVVAVELFALARALQHVSLSSMLQVPRQVFLVERTKPFLHVFGCLPEPPSTLKPNFVSLHIVLQQAASSVDAQGLPLHLSSETASFSEPFGQVLTSFVVAPFNFQPLAHDCWQQVPASLAPQEDPVQ
jgi:hypothetical protein